MKITDVEKQIVEALEIDGTLLPVAGSDEEKFKAFRDLLKRRIEELAENNMERLMWMLYRIDVSEKKLREATAKAAPENFSSVIADLIIERQLEKVKTRKQFGEGETEWNFDI